MIRRPLRVGGLFALALCSLAEGGCSSMSSTGGDPGCHWDCFGRVECVDGVVTQWNHGPVACAFWTGSCPKRVVATCSASCAVSSMPGFTVCPTTICRENYPKTVGDPCASGADCLPTPAMAGVANVYLRCDLNQQQCVTADPPVLADWLEPCTTGVGERYRGTGSWGAVTDPSCSEKLCFVYDDRVAACLKQGCSKSCRLDAECPQGAICQREIGACDTLDAPQVGYCKPGATGLTGKPPACSAAP